MKKHYRKENDCLNCGTTLQGPFCYNCGQENLQIKESFGHMMNHAISDYFHFDHKFFHTLKPLFFKPGLLTNEYMAGRRTRYLHPVKMYIFISVVYFLLLFQSGHEIAKVNNPNGKPVSAQKTIDSLNKEINKDKDLSVTQKKALQQEVLKYGAYGTKYANGKITHSSSSFLLSDDTTYKQYTDRQAKLPQDKRDGFFTSTLAKKMLSYREKYGSRAQEVFIDEFKHNIPKMMFVLLPIFALILSITFRKNKKYYVEHLIYTFHLYCFLFLFSAIVILLEMVTPVNQGIIEWLNFLATIYIIWYLYSSLKVVYHRSRFRTITKMTGMSFVGLFTSIVCLMLLLVITALTAT